VTEQDVRELARADLVRRLARTAAAVAGEHLGPEPGGLLAGRDRLGRLRLFRNSSTAAARSAAVNTGTASAPSAGSRGPGT